MVIEESDTKTPLFNAEILHQNATYSMNLDQIKEPSSLLLEPVQLTEASKQKANVVVKTKKTTNDVVTEKATNIQPEPTKKATKKAFEPIYPMIDK